MVAEGCTREITEQERQHSEIMDQLGTLSQRVFTLENQVQELIRAHNISIRPEGIARRR